MEKYIIPQGNGITGDTYEQVRTGINSNFDAALPRDANYQYIPANFDWSGFDSAFSNCIWDIKDTHDLQGINVILPEGVTLFFNGGKLLNVGNLQGLRSKIVNPSNTQCFDTNVTFTGTWYETVVTPQWFGAVTNLALTTFENDCSSYINFALTTPFDVKFPKGYYYVANPIYIPKKVTIDLGGGLESTYGNELYNYDTGVDQVAVSNMTHVRIYTDQNIHVVNIQAGSVNMLGGIIDTTQVTGHTKAAIRYDLGYMIWGGYVTTAVLGDWEQLITPGIGTIGVLFDSDNPVNTHGYASMVKLYNVISECAVGVWVKEALNTAPNYTWATDLDINCQTNGCKRAIWMQGGGASYIRGSIQPLWRAPVEESGWAAIKLDVSNITIDVFVWDLSFGYSEIPYQSGIYRYRNAYSIENNGTNYLAGRSNFAYATVIGGGRFMHTDITNVGDVKLLDTRSNMSTFISVLDNQFTAWGKREDTTFTINKYAGAGVDFDALLEPSAGASADYINLEYGANLFTRVSAYGPPRFTFLTGADLDTDYIEIVLNKPTTMIIKQFHVLLNDAVAHNKRIQMIFLDEGVPKTWNDGADQSVYNFYPVAGAFAGIYTPKIPGQFGFQTAIIRFIGCAFVDRTITICDIAGRKTYLDFNPIVTVEGGQTIYGELTMENIKLTDTPVYENNTAALSGGLVAGKIYRTSTGVLMQVF